MAGFTELYKAIESDNTYEVRRLVHNGININTRDSMKRTVLHHAAEQKNKKMAKLLVQLGAGVNARDIHRKTPLHYVLTDKSQSVTTNSLIKDHQFMAKLQRIRSSVAEIKEIMESRIVKEVTDMIDCLHHLGADINASFDDVTSLHEAVRRKNIPLINVLLRLGIDVNIHQITGKRAVSYIVRWKEVFKHLVHLGADVKYIYSSETALNVAVKMGRLDIVQILLEHGADVNDVILNNLSPIIEVIAHGITDLEVYKCITRQGGDLNFTFITEFIIHEAVKLKDTKIIKYLVQHGAAKLACMKTRITPIGLAVATYKNTVLECLLNCGADINYRYDPQVPLLIDVIWEGNSEMAESLIDLGADINSHAVEGTDALFEAVTGLSSEQLQTLQDNTSDIRNPRIATFQDPPTEDYVNITQLFGASVDILRKASIVKMLLRLGADVNARYDHNVSLVHDAVARNDVKMIQVLSQLGADMDIQKHEGLTVLNMALLENSGEEVVKLLITEGADINARYNNQVSPIHHAMSLSNTKMVQLLSKFGAKINNNFLVTGKTALNQAVELQESATVNLLLKYGANINAKCVAVEAPIHIAVARSDKKMIRVLGHLGADLNAKKYEGLTVLCSSLLHEKGRQIDTVRTLVAAGADLNAGFNKNVTALHDAVKASNLKVVKTLALLGADMNRSKHEGMKPLHLATLLGLQEIIECLVEYGADMNVEYAVGVRPLHDAVSLGDREMFECLIRSGANVRVGKETGLSPMHIATNRGNTELMKYLVKGGADINTTSSREINALHIAQEYGNEEMIDSYVRLGLMRHPKIERVSLLHEPTLKHDIEAMECLLSLGIIVNRKQRFLVLPSDDTSRYLEKYLRICGFSSIDLVGSSPLHTACSTLGNTDLARLLIIAGSDCNMRGHHRMKPLEMLPLAHTLDYHVLHEAATTERVTEQVRQNSGYRILCQNIESIHSTPGLGDVQYIHAPKSRDISKSIHKFLQVMLDRCKLFSTAKLKGCGSANEGTRVGLPTEMDFLFQLELVTPEERSIVNAGYGYVYYVNPSSQLFKEGSKSFHSIFSTEISEAISYLRHRKHAGKLTVTNEVREVEDGNRKASSPLMLKWGDEHFRIFNLNLYISVDTVPCLHVDNWPEGAINNTWLMDHHYLRQKGYILVPKPPHMKSDLAKRFSTKELQPLWRMSFAHLETEHMQRLEKRVKNVYVTAKTLRNPDVCRIMITDEGSLPRNVDRYITSYHLKMMFLKNVENFLSSDQSLGAMVSKVYDDLEENLSEGYIPLFFMPSINVLDGLELNIPKCAKVAKIMKKFVQGLYQRDSQEDTIELDEEEEIIIYQRKPRTVYRSIEICP